MKKIGRLHILTDKVVQTRFSHVELARLALAGGADTIQLREKRGTTRKLIDASREMKGVCSEAGVPFIVNDRLDVAIASEADGVHLGQEDFPIPLARKLLGEDRLIGGSAGNLEEAGKCLSEGADYVGFGPVYPTGSKEDAGPAGGIDLLKEVVKAIPLPVIAIGGITHQNAAEVIRAGAYGIAVISAVCCREEPEKATRGLLELIYAAAGRSV
jgi:thiamine-phosphate pyrophosphorylase